MHAPFSCLHIFLQLTLEQWAFEYGLPFFDTHCTNMTSKINAILLTSSFSNFPENSVIEWNLVIKRSDITKPSYNKVLTLYISLMFKGEVQ